MKGIGIEDESSKGQRQLSSIDHLAPVDSDRSGLKPENAWSPLWHAQPHYKAPRWSDCLFCSGALTDCFCLFMGNKHRMIILDVLFETLIALVCSKGSMLWDNLEKVTLLKLSQIMYSPVMCEEPKEEESSTQISYLNIHSKRVLTELWRPLIMLLITYRRNLSSPCDPTCLYLWIWGYGYHTSTPCIRVCSLSYPFVCRACQKNYLNWRKRSYLSCRSIQKGAIKRSPPFF